MFMCEHVKKPENSVLNSSGNATDKDKDDAEHSYNILKLSAFISRSPLNNGQQQGQPVRPGTVSPIILVFYTILSKKSQQIR